MHAGYLALVRNAPHFYRNDKRPWSPDDFLGAPSVESSHSESDLAVLKAQMFMMTHKPEELESLGWAVGPYKGRLLKRGG